MSTLKIIDFKPTWTKVGNGLLVLMALSVFLPFFWLTLGSFKTGAQLNNPALIFFSPTLDNWKEVLTSGVLESP